MKLQVMSDLHLEFDDFQARNAGADVLVLSGDICVASYLKKSMDSPYHIKGQRFREFFHYAAMEFPEVVYVMGNHEHYHSRFEDTANILREYVDQFTNFHFLDTGHVDLFGHRFIGGTLWTKISSPIDESMVQQGLNDFHVIKTGDYRKFRVAQANREHDKMLNYIDQHLVDNTIVVGHHGPSWRSVEERYRTGRYAHLNPAYVTELDGWIHDRSQIKCWTHGHVHSCHDYYIGTTRVVCNPRGYRDENPSFDPNKVWEI